MNQLHHYPSDLLTIQQLADLLQIHHQTVRKWIKQDRIKYIHLGSRIIRIPLSEVERIKEYVKPNLPASNQNSQPADEQDIRPAA